MYIHRPSICHNLCSHATAVSMVFTLRRSGNEVFHGVSVEILVFLLKHAPETLPSTWMVLTSYFAVPVEQS